MDVRQNITELGQHPRRILSSVRSGCSVVQMDFNLSPPGVTVFGEALYQRAVVLLHYVEDFSIEEIAGITEAQPGTVKSRLHYAKKALRKLLEAKNENAA